MQARDRKVGFVPEIDEEPDKDYRLRRRDTPHYLKNKRVNKEEDAAQKVREILAQAAMQKEDTELKVREILAQAHAQKEAAAISTNLKVRGALTRSLTCVAHIVSRLEHFSLQKRGRGALYMFFFGFLKKLLLLLLLLLL